MLEIIRIVGNVSLDHPFCRRASYALKNSGYDVWPNFIRMMIGEPGQVFEDMIFTCTVSDGMSSDSETFPVSSVNYPVTNMPPLIEDVKDQYFEVGKVGTYQIVAHDPDQGDIITFEGRVTHPWGNAVGCTCDLYMIDRLTGTISFFVYREEKMNFVAIVKDSHDMYSVAEFTIFCVDPEPEPVINRPPEIVTMIESPQRIRAGQVFLLPGPCFQDPDGDPLYYSCNIGSFTEKGGYSLLTYFPGTYQITLMAYDMRGRSAAQEFTLEVLPWWSY
ncbi:MAG: hypothetical protein ACMUIA_08825 [bacterium]